MLIFSSSPGFDPKFYQKKPCTQEELFKCMVLFFAPGAPLHLPGPRSSRQRKDPLEALPRHKITVCRPTHYYALQHSVHQKYPTPRLSKIPNLPIRHYVNLTNGIEVLRVLQLLGISQNEVRFTRLQSTVCEARAWNVLLDLLDTDLIFSLACGHVCYLYDIGSRSKGKNAAVPRAIWMGVEFVKYALTYFWAGADKRKVPDTVIVRGKNVAPYWRDEVCQFQIDKPVKKRIKYFKDYAEELGFWSDGMPHLRGVYGDRTRLDGCKDVHVKLARDSIEQPWASETPAACDPKRHEEMLLEGGLHVFTSQVSFSESAVRQAEGSQLRESGFAS